jgi:hypothetical protein
VSSGEAVRQGTESTLVEEVVRRIKEADETAFPPSEDKSGITGGE